jgi:HYDIN/CFA65/VesB family protein
MSSRASIRRSIMVRAIALTGLCGFVIAARAAYSHALGQSSSRLSLRQTEVDLGDVPLGTAPAGAIIVANSGGSRLVVNPEVTKCGWCSDDFSLIVPANEQRLLPLQLDPQQRPGLLTEKLRFHTNDPANPTFDITVRGRVYVQKTAG